MTKTIAALALLAAFGLASSHADAQSRPLVAPEAAAIYQRLLPQISRIKLFDHHAHPAFPDDADVDIAPPPPGATPLRLRPENPETVAAARALFGFPFADMVGAHGKWLVDRKAALKRQYPGADVFQRRPRPARHRDVDGQSRRDGATTSIPRGSSGCSSSTASCFRSTTRALATNPDRAVYMPLQTKLLQRYAQQLGLASPLPATFGDYLSFLTRTLEENQRRGGVAVKFEASYFRSLSFGDPGGEIVEPIYLKYRAGGVPTPEEYTRFQDFIFRHLIIVAARLKLPVHIHTSAGGGDYFDLRGVNVLNLEHVVRDPKHRQTTFVLIHGGYPYDREAILLASMKNVYLDSSATGADAVPDGVQERPSTLAGGLPGEADVRHRRVSLQRSARRRRGVLDGRAHARAPRSPRRWRR